MAPINTDPASTVGQAAVAEIGNISAINGAGAGLVEVAQTLALQVGETEATGVPHQNGSVKRCDDDFQPLFGEQLLLGLRNL